MERKELEQTNKKKLTRDVVGFEGLYTIDIFGNITNLRTNKYMKQYMNIFGYMNVRLTKNKKQKEYKVHRLIAEAFIPNPQHKKQVNHIDGNKANNVVWNLEWTTNKDNCIHAADTGLTKSGKKVRIIETGEVFNSIGSCARKIEGNACNISRCLYNTAKNYSHKGLHFEWVHE